ncbi:MAG: glycosyltransferase family 4 protein [Methanothrix sp.]|jgi:glycosyltransferase involved in cell wall biosynthesis|uniref:glycosyltransferase family 4 protein n=1 Tax=Methanothrix sp. TaxID=90426 RepID=UPI00247E8894|nr:glycosyltransferase family 4 protein [Methanothrix sp.]
MEQANVLGTGKPLFSSDLERKYIQKASLVIALNQYMWNYLKYKYQIWNKKVVFIPNAYENEFCNLYASAYKSVVNRFNICYVGGLTKNRGIELIVKVCKKLHEKYPYLKLYLFGSYGEAISSELKETIENSEFIIRKQIRRKDLPSSLLEMDLLIMPYDPRNDYMNFSSPTKLFEYIGTCKPILCTKCKSLLDIGETGGIMYIDYDESDIKNKIELLILNPQLREKLSNELMNIRLHHTWQERAKILHNALASLDKCHE